MATTEKKKKKEEESRMKRAMKALALAGIERLGKESAANQVATNTFLLHDIADLLKEEITHILVWGGTRAAGKCLEIYNIEKNEWRRGPEVPKRDEHGLARVGRRVFAIGGATNSVQAFNIERETLEEMPPMSMKRSRPGIGVVDDKIFVLGGRKDSQTNTCEAFVVPENKWEPIAPMHVSRYEFGVCVIGHRIFVFGGYNGSYVADCEVLDTKKNVWKKLSPMPTARQGVAIGCVDGRNIFVLGGLAGGIFVKIIEVYDVEEDKWTSLGDGMPWTRVSSSSVAVGKKIFITGGHPDGFNPLADVDIFDPEAMTFEKAAPMLIPHTWHGAVGF